MPGYDGVPLFGRSVKVRHEPNPSKKTYTEFYGLHGLYMTFGGSRGRMFFVEGILNAVDDPTLDNWVATILSYDDGVGRVLVDTRNQAWPEVVFDRFQPGDRYLKGEQGAFLEYRMTFMGLI